MLKVEFHYEMTFALYGNNVIENAIYKSLEYGKNKK